MLATRICLNSSSSNSTLSLLFLGGDAFSIGVLEPLLASKPGLYKDLLIVTSGEKTIGRGSRGSSRIVPPLLNYAEEQGLDTSILPSTGFKDWQIPSKFLPSGASDSNLEAGPTSSPILITASFGHIIPTPFLKTYFAQSSSRLNVHPSLLPQYRGSAPIQWSIADSWRDRTARTGVTVQSLALGRGKVDCGDIWAQEGDVEINEHATYGSMMPILARKGGDLLVSTLRRIRENNARSYPQPLEGDFRKASKINPTTARIDLLAQSALEIEARHRAFGFQEPIWTTFQGNPLQLLDVGLARADDVDLSPGQAYFDRTNDRLLIRCACASVLSEEGTFLEVKKVHQAGKKVLSIRDYWNGLRGIGKSRVIDLGS